MLLSKKTIIPDLLFGGQLIMSIVFCGAQFLRSQEDVHGVSVIQFALAVAFVGFNFRLTLGAHRARASRVTLQGLVNQGVWAVMLTAVVFAVLGNDAYVWSVQDAIISGFAAVLTAATLVFGRLKGVPVQDPRVLATLAIICKSIPQLLLVWIILDVGGSGIPWQTIIAGHVTIWIRITQIYLMLREAKREENRIWLLVSESANELSWIVVTLVWLAST